VLSGNSNYIVFGPADINATDNSVGEIAFAKEFDLSLAAVTISIWHTSAPSEPPHSCILFGIYIDAEERWISVTTPPPTLQETTSSPPNPNQVYPFSTLERVLSTISVSISLLLIIVGAIAERRNRSHLILASILPADTDDNNPSIISPAQDNHFQAVAFEQAEKI